MSDAWLSKDISIVLASASPRRRELLSLLSLPFYVVVADVDETDGDGELPQVMVQRLSQDKALTVFSQDKALSVFSQDKALTVFSQDKALTVFSQDKALTVAARHPQVLVIAADTTVALDGESLGKPSNAAEATAMLRALRGRPHQVYSGLTVLQGDQILTELVESIVWMRHYSEEEIVHYVASGDPLDKAGSYAVQHAGFHPADRVEGCFANVMGLPLCHLARMLVQLGVPVPVDVPAVCQAHTGFMCQFLTVSRGQGTFR
jgi:septum formation protein